MLHLALVVGLLVLAPPCSAWAATPRETLRGVFAEATRLLADPETEERPLDRYIALEKLAGDAFDFRGTAELVFGRRWPRLTRAEQDEFTHLFANLLGRSFLFRMVSKARLEGGGDVLFLGESIQGADAIVRTSISRRGRDDMLASYRMIERDGHWKVRDVIVDGISTAENYRAQLDRVLETASVSDLLTRMRARARGSTPAASAAVSTAAAAPTPAAPAPAAPPTPAAPAAVAVARPAAPAPVRSAPTTKAYWLQVGTFTTVAEANQLAARIRGSKVVSTTEGEGAAARSVARVRIGPFADAAQAVLELLELQTKGFDPYLVAERH
jgi:phospholipid transport system substrate-binding protein